MLTKKDVTVLFDNTRKADKFIRDHKSSVHNIDYTWDCATATVVFVTESRAVRVILIHNLAEFTAAAATAKRLHNRLFNLCSNY